MVIRQGYDHDGPYDNLTVDNYWAILYGVHTFWNRTQLKNKDSKEKTRNTEDGSLREVNNRCSI